MSTRTQGQGPSPDEALGRRFEAALERDDPFALRDAIVELAEQARDRRWAETCCVRLARHRNAEVRGSALLGFAHLARRFGNLDQRRVRRLVENGLYAANEVVRECAESAATDLENYLRWEFDRP